MMQSLRMFAVSKTFKSLFVLAALVFYVLVSPDLCSGVVLIQTGFEDDDVGKIPQTPEDAWEASGGGFEVGTDNPREEKKSLGVLGGQGDNALAVNFETASEIITAEFWLYVDGATRGLCILFQAPGSGLTDWASAGPYLNPIGEKMRHYPGAWEDIGAFPIKEWKYVRLVVNVGDSTYDMYVGNSLEEAHAGKPLGNDLGFRAPLAAIGRMSFSTYAQEAPAYVDNLLIYEGGTLPEGLFAVEPADKLPAIWSQLKKY